MTNFEMIFNSIPISILLLSPELIILGVTDNYLNTTLTTRNAIIGKPLYEIFPNNPKDIGAIEGEKNFRESIKRVLETKKLDRMLTQKYDIPSKTKDNFEVRYWNSYNIPVLAEDGTVTAIIHQVEDVTHLVLLKNEIHDEAVKVQTQLGK